ncbi:hypothetical protein ACWDSJ_16115 [Nocardia sp. NPDC003482]
MNKLALVIRDLHRAEGDLADELLRVSDRHKADHDIFHLARDLADWSRAHQRALTRAARPRGVRIFMETALPHKVSSAVRQRTSELLGRRHTPALLLLRDLRTVHAKAVVVSLDWEILAQSAQATEDAELLELATRCHGETLRQMQWSNAKLKESAAQAIATP